MNLIRRAYALLTVQDVAITGLNPSFVAADVAGDTFPNDGRSYLEVVNGGGGAITVTIDDLRSVAPEGAAAFDPDPDISVPAGETRKIGPFEKSRFDDDASVVAVSYSGVTSVTVGVFSL